MKLKELLKDRMKKERYRSSDLAKQLSQSRQSTSYALGRQINNIKLGTFRQYLSILGLRLDLTTGIKIKEGLGDKKCLNSH